MKKLLIALTVLMSLALTSQAQFLNWGVRGGAGLGFHLDDIPSSSPVLAANVGAFVTFGFTQSQSLAADNFCLQTGLNFIRRGSHFQEVYEKGLLMSLREGYYTAYYLQVPLLATIRYELPLRNPGHRVLFSVGPAFGYGLFGDYVDRKISRGFPQPTWNYEKHEDAFTVLNRVDASIIIGAGYEWKDLSFMLHFDLGLLAVSQSEDHLKASQRESIVERYISEHLDAETVASCTPELLEILIEQQRQDGERYADQVLSEMNLYVPGGNNFAVMFTIGYQFPIR